MRLTNRRHLMRVDAQALSWMRPHAVLVKTARGRLIDEAALETRRIGAAALDVFELEPLPSESPLTRLDNVVLSPHVGYSTLETYGRFCVATIQMLHAYYHGSPVSTL